MRSARTKQEPDHTPPPRNPGGQSSGSRRPPEPERPPVRSPMKGGERPSKKSKAAPGPPGDPGSEPDWDDEDEYTYEYEDEDEAPESERRTDDPSVAVTNASRHRPLRLRPREIPENPPPPRPGGRGGDGDPVDPGQDNLSEISTARTSEMREVLMRQSRREGDRSKPSLSQVRIEPFRGAIGATTKSGVARWRHSVPFIALMRANLPCWCI